MVNDINPVEAAVDKELGLTQLPKRNGPMYQVYAGSKIPVSKFEGKVWKSRRDVAKKCVEDYSEAWSEAVRYYNHDQLMHRDTNANGEMSGNSVPSRRMNNRWSQTENIVFANTTAMIPALYAKNPECEFQTPRDDIKPLAQALQLYLNTIINRKASPGINMKPKAKRAVLMSTLMNISWFYLGYTFKEDSNEQVIATINDLSNQLVKAKSGQEIEDIEGKLQALDEVIDMYTPAGSWLKIKAGTEVYVDPDAEEPDFSDARWMMIQEIVPTSWLIAKFGSHEPDGSVKSIYEPTHILRNGISEQTADDDVKNFSIFKQTDTTQTMKQYGYDDEVSYNKAKRTMVFMIWDKIKQRVCMYHSNRWDYPIWVWDDPLKLDTFFPLVPLSFHMNPDGTYAKGEVTYYLDQQDAINEINDESRRARQWARRNILFDSSAMSREDVEQFLKGDDGTARGVKLPDGKKMSDVIFSMPTPAFSFPQLFDKSAIYQAIDRLSSANDIMRGAQFKTNTTNKAIENYNSSNNMRLDEKIDAIEDALSQVVWMLAQLTLQFTEPETIAAVIGQDQAINFQNMQWDEIRTNLPSISVVAGSTAKATSSQRKQQALDMGQVLGQFQNGAPATVTKIVLRLFESAFADIIDVKSSDWEAIDHEFETTMAQGAPAGGQPQGQGQPHPAGGPQQQTQPQPGAQSPDINSLPPQAKQAVQIAVSHGVPLPQAIQHVTQQLQQQPPGAGPQPNQ